MATEIRTVTTAGRERTVHQGAGTWDQPHSSSSTTSDCSVYANNTYPTRFKVNLVKDSR